MIALRVRYEVMPSMRARAWVQAATASLARGWAARLSPRSAIKAHAALGGQLVHGCQSVPDQSGGVVAPYGASMANFLEDLADFKAGRIEQVYAHRVTAAE